MAQMQARGMGASSIAGQAMVQAKHMESLHYQWQWQMHRLLQGLKHRTCLTNSNVQCLRQQRAKFIGMEFDQAFQARVINASKISDIANMNFTAEQQIALENSRIANTMNLANLSNRQALVMAEASALANLDMANLNNRGRCTGSKCTELYAKRHG